MGYNWMQRVQGPTVDARDVHEGDAGLGHFLELRLGFAEVHRAAAAAHAAEAAAAALATLRAAEEEEQPAERDEREQQVAEQARQVALLVALGDGDVDAVLREDVDELRVVGERDGGAAAVNGGELERRPVLAEAHALHLAAHHALDELAVAPVVTLGQPVRINHGGGRGGLRVPGEGGGGLRLELSERGLGRLRYLCGGGGKERECQCVGLVGVFAVCLTCIRQACIRRLYLGSVQQTAYCYCLSL